MTSAYRPRNKSDEVRIAVEKKLKTAKSKQRVYLEFISYIARLDFFSENLTLNEMSVFREIMNGIIEEARTHTKAR